MQQSRKWLKMKEITLLKNNLKSYLFWLILKEYRINCIYERFHYQDYISILDRWKNKNAKKFGDPVMRNLKQVLEMPIFQSILQSHFLIIQIRKKQCRIKNNVLFFPENQVLNFITLFNAITLYTTIIIILLYERNGTF
jgi:hypothetical protein